VKTTGFTSFPPYLFVHLRRYYVAEDWTAKKLEVLVDMPEKLSLETLRSAGPQVRSIVSVIQVESESISTIVFFSLFRSLVRNCSLAGKRRLQSMKPWLRS
jgi:hypothetical protein